jgi:hypothetical protein
MNANLNQYISRSDEITRNSKILFDIDLIHEHDLMIDKLQNTLYHLLDNKNSIVRNEFGESSGEIKKYALRTNEEKLPEYRIYKNTKDNLYEIDINGLILRGKMGIITNKNSPLKMNKTYACRKNNCKKSGCRFYHKGEVRNFINTSWLFSEKPVTQTNRHMRHFGNRSTLIKDIEYLKASDKNYLIEKVDEYKLQVMHDLLVLLFIKENYPYLIL